MKFNIITHITTACNYDCSYCDVKKDRRFISQKQKKDVIDFIWKNQNSINRFKFFGGEPLLTFNDIRDVIDQSNQYIWNNFEIVTNTTLLNDKIWEYLQKYFSHIFFSIDSENIFLYEKVLEFIKKHTLEKKLYFNLIISPWKETVALAQFQKLYDAGVRGFNILPVYFTQTWSKWNLQELWKIMKNILDKSLQDTSLRLYGFMENLGYDTSLANNTIFIDIDGEVYYSDIASTFSWEKIKQDLHLWNVTNLELDDLHETTFEKQQAIISWWEENIYNAVQWQRELHKIMDYFSHYLNQKNG